MISYNAAQIRDIILSCGTLVEFTFHGLDCNIDPFVPTSFHIFCNGDEWDVNSIDEVMNGKFFDGFCLRDIASQIHDLSW